MLILTLTSTALAATPTAGDLVFTELHPSPKRSSCEFVELVAPAGGTFELDGCLLIVEDDNPDSASLDGITLSGTDPQTLGALTGSCEVAGLPELCVAFDADGECMNEAEGAYGSKGGITASQDTTFCLASDSAASCADPGVVDVVSFNWGDFSGSCDEDAYPGRCSMQLNGSVLSEAAPHEANDDMGHWDVVDPNVDTYTYDGNASEDTADANLVAMQASPGDLTSWVVLPTCAAGEVFISEVMTSPPQSFREWIEVAGRSDSASACALEGCWFAREGSDADDTLGPIDGEPVVDIGGFTLLTHHDSNAFDVNSSGEAVPSDATYDYSFWLDEGPYDLILMCEDGSGTAYEVDRAAIDATELADRCPEDAGCSLNLAPDLHDGTSNDSAESFCLPSLATAGELYDTDDEGEIEAIDVVYGTPGELGQCQTYNWPEVGEVYFSEVFAQGSSGDVPDWVELTSVASETVELQWCELRELREADDTGSESLELTRSYTFASATQSYEVAAGAHQVLVKSTCLDTLEGADSGGAETTDTGASDDSEETEVCGDGAFIYGSLFLSTDETQGLQLVCDGTVIDEVEWNLLTSDVGWDQARSVMLRPELEGADGHELNDDVVDASWCPASYLEQQFLDLGEGECNYGTPGAANDCFIDRETPGPTLGCMCTTTPGDLDGRGPLGVIAVLGGLLLAGLRRRR